MIWLWLIALAPDEEAVLQARRAEEHRRIEAAAQKVLSSVCAGRCELLEVAPELKLKKSRPEALPGFETMTDEKLEAELSVVTLTVAVDAQLPAATKAGLQTALQSVAGAAPVRVQAKVFDWGAPRRDAGPLVVQVQTPAPPAPADLPKEKPDVAARLADRFVDTAPWLVLGIMALLALHLWRSRRDSPASRLPTAQPSDPVPAAPAPPTPFVRRAQNQRALAVHTARLAFDRLPPDRAAGVLAWLGPEVVDDFHNPPPLPIGKQDARGLADAEALAMEAARDTLHDARLWMVPAMPPETFALTADALPAEAKITLLAHAPSPLRLAYLELQDEDGRRALLGAALTRAAKADAVVPQIVAEEIATTCHAKLQATRVLEALLEDISSLTARGDDRLAATLAASHPGWARLLSTALAGEEALLQANDSTLEQLVYALQPEVIADYAAVAPAVLAERLPLPSYIRALVPASVTPERATEVKRLVLVQLRRSAVHLDRRALIDALSLVPSALKVVKS